MKYILLLLGALILAVGVVDAYSGWKNPEPIRMTVAEYMNSDKSAKWVILTDAKINMLQAVVVMKKKDKEVVTRLYLPIESDSFKQEALKKLLLSSKDKKLLALASTLHNLPAAEQLKYIAQHKDALIFQQEISGNMLSADGMKNSHKDDVKKLMKNLDDDFYLLLHNAHPSFKRGLGIFVVGLVLLLLGWRKKKKA